MNSQPIKIAILAMGGEGGGVLADWIVGLGEHEGHIAQTTSVPGVAQRTGATIYYVELFSQAAAEGRQPVLALMPMPGDVDVVLASELMEAGRAVQRGLVTPERTTLIASTHRVYAIAEKAAMGDGRVDSAELLAHVHTAAKRVVAFDMAQAAEQEGGVISAVLFGALAASAVLPFARDAFEATIRRGGLGVLASLAAFDHAFTLALATPEAAARPVAAAPPLPTRAAHPHVQALLDRIHRRFAAPARGLLIEGVRRLIDYQDPAYATLYLERLERLAPLDQAADAPLLHALARHLALWMSYEDTVRVADLKTRGTRFERVRTEAHAEQAQVLGIDEYLHPRLQEICDSLPVAVGRWLANSGVPRRLVQRATRHGRTVQTSSLRGYGVLWLVARLKRWRRGSLRFEVETARIEAWLARVERVAQHDTAVALEVVNAQRLVKGYGDTHERGWRNFDTIMAAFDDSGGLPATTLRELVAAALADEQGERLRALLTALPPAIHAL